MTARFDVKRLLYYNIKCGQTFKTLEIVFWDVTFASLMMRYKKVYTALYGSLMPIESGSYIYYHSYVEFYDWTNENMYLAVFAEHMCKNMSIAELFINSCNWNIKIVNSMKLYAQE